METVDYSHLLAKLKLHQPEALFIFGPTASGKTKLAFKLAQEFGYDLISVDSRQVYRLMDIVTGKDMPANFRYVDQGSGSYYQSPAGFRVYGLSFLNSDQPYSLGQFLNLLPGWWQEIKRRQRRPILVGGTIHWFYRLLTTSYDQVLTPRQPVWRQQAQNLSLVELQKQLLKLQPGLKTELNQSDWLNRRRLIRWYERLSQSPKEDKLIQKLDNWLSRPKVSLCPNKSFEGLELLIKARVKQRLAAGAISETKMIIDKYSNSIIGFDSPGYRQIIRFLNSQVKDKNQLIQEWVQAELLLVKKQQRWLAKMESFIDFKVED